jgi:hypothetical protein
MSVLVGDGLALSAFGLAGGPDPWAAATPAPASSYHWCPGDQWNPGWAPVSDWDWNHCHDWQHPGGPYGQAGFGPWAPAAVGVAEATSTAVGTRG